MVHDMSEHGSKTFCVDALVLWFINSVTYFYMLVIETLHFVQSDKRCHSEAQPKNLL
jgi:hypothetical protein